MRSFFDFTPVDAFVHEDNGSLYLHHAHESNEEDEDHWQGDQNTVEGVGVNILGNDCLVVRIIWHWLRTDGLSGSNLGLGSSDSLVSSNSYNQTSWNLVFTADKILSDGFKVCVGNCLVNHDERNSLSSLGSCLNLSLNGLRYSCTIWNGLDTVSSMVGVSLGKDGLVESSRNVWIKLQGKRNLRLEVWWGR